MKRAVIMTRAREASLMALIRHAIGVEVIYKQSQPLNNETTEHLLEQLKIFEQFLQAMRETPDAAHALAALCPLERSALQTFYRVVSSDQWSLHGDDSHNHARLRRNDRRGDWRVALLSAYLPARPVAGMVTRGMPWSCTKCYPPPVPLNDSSNKEQP